MGRAGTVRDEYARQAGETHLEWTMRRARMKADARDRTEPIVPIEAQRHGEYSREFVTHVETATKADAMVNRGGDAIDRWKDRGRLSKPQIAAIDLCRRLWRLAGLNQRLTASYGERIPGMGNVEHRAINEIEARDDLHRIRGYVPSAYFDVFENIVRHGMGIGETAAVAGYTGSGSEIRAYTVVCFVADLIAMNERL